MLQFASHVLWECRQEGFVQPVAMLLPRALLCAFRVADVKEFMTLSTQMLNVRTFPCFAAISEHVATNIALIRSGCPPHVPILDSNMSQAEVPSCLFRIQLEEALFLVLLGSIKYGMT